MLQDIKSGRVGRHTAGAVEVIRAAIFVDEGIKVTIEAENSRKGATVNAKDRIIPDEENLML